MTIKGNPLRILFILDTTDRGERNMIIGMNRQGVDTTVVCRPDAPGRVELEAAGINVVPIHFRTKLDSAARKALRQLLSQNNFDLVHVFSKKPLINWTLATLGRKTPPVVAYRGIIGNMSYWDPFSWLSFLNPNLARWVCVCEAIRQYFLNKKFLLAFSLFKPERVVTIHKGHRLEWYQQQGGEPLLPTVGVPAGAPVIGCIARMKKRKGILELIRSMESISADKPPHLVLIGRVLDEEIRTACEASPCKDRIHLLGFHPDAARMAGEFDILTLPSLRREGLPRAVIEGMAQGIVPVVSDSGGNPELVEDGISGLVVPAGDAEALAKAFSQLLNDPVQAQKMGGEAKNRIRDHFNVERTIEQTLALYSDVLKERA